jgi:hypothetical protein
LFYFVAHAPTIESAPAMLKNSSIIFRKNLFKSTVKKKEVNY